jgi:hypothetical protein
LQAGAFYKAMKKKATAEIMKEIARLLVNINALQAEIATLRDKQTFLLGAPSGQENSSLDAVA